MDVEHREVIVVGAGPAGTSCAQRLAEEDIDVLILERRAVVGNPAQCGECIPNWGEVQLPFSHFCLLPGPPAGPNMSSKTPNVCLGAPFFAHIPFLS